jgi:hypothetical protein
MALVETKASEVVKATCLANIISENFSGHEIRVDKETGYICVSDICKAGNSEWSRYSKLEGSKAFIEELSASLCCGRTELIKTIQGGSSKLQGTWAHSRIVTHMCFTKFPKFAFSVTGWIEEWKTQKQENEMKYQHALQTLELSESYQKEKKIQERLKEELSAEIEVETNVGKIDLMLITILNIRRLYFYLTTNLLAK